jgi:uncharacterized membrane protein
MYGGGGWIWMSFMMVFWLVVLVALIYLVIRLAQQASTEHSRESRR